VNFNPQSVWWSRQDAPGFVAADAGSGKGLQRCNFASCSRRGMRRMRKRKVFVSWICRKAAKARFASNPGHEHLPLSHAPHPAPGAGREIATLKPFAAPGVRRDETGRILTGPPHALRVEIHGARRLRRFIARLWIRVASWKNVTQR